MRGIFLHGLKGLLLMLAGCVALGAQAQERAVQGSEVQAIETVIRAQLAAFAADDAERAFSYAAPAIRNLFHTPDNFLAMVRHSYPVVYRPATVSFLKPVTDGGEVVQPVRMTDAEGGLWLALYSMQRQATGAWLTSGCRLLRSQGQVT